MTHLSLNNEDIDKEKEKNMVKILTILNAIPQQPQRQDSTNDQLSDLRMIANRLGMYDAADILKNLTNGSR